MVCVGFARGSVLSPPNCVEVIERFLAKIACVGHYASVLNNKLYKDASTLEEVVSSQNEILLVKNGWIS